jgi:hypothetical protein
VTYHKMHTYQTVDFVRGKHAFQLKWLERMAVRTVCIWALYNLKLSSKVREPWFSSVDSRWSL